MAVTVNGDLTCVCQTTGEFDTLVLHVTDDPTLSVLSQDRPSLTVVVRVTVT